MTKEEIGLDGCYREKIDDKSILPSIITSEINLDKIEEMWHYVSDRNGNEFYILTIDVSQGNPANYRSFGWYSQISKDNWQKISNSNSNHEPGNALSSLIGSIADTLL